MQQRTRRLFGHACIAVGGSGDDALEQPQDPAHAVLLIECGDEVHFGGTRISEADVDIGAHQSFQQTVRSIHSGALYPQLAGLRPPKATAYATWVMLD